MGRAQSATISVIRLSENPVFVLINAYAVSTSHMTLANILTDLMSGFNGQVDSGELTIKQTGSARMLSTGIWGRWYTS